MNSSELALYALLGSVVLNLFLWKTIIALRKDIRRKAILLDWCKFRIHDCFREDFDAMVRHNKTYSA